MNSRFSGKFVIGVFLFLLIFLGIFLFVMRSGLFLSKSRYLCKDCNIILISIDTLRQDHLGIYGYKRNTTPNIDSFFKDGIVFHNQFSQSSNTLPSHMSIFTSLYPQEHQVMYLTDSPLQDSRKTLVQILKENGYKTLGLYAGSDHLNPKFGFDRGFDLFLPKSRDEGFVFGELDKLKDEKKKFFLFLHPYHPHDPYVVPEKYSQKFTDPGYQGKIDSKPENYSKEVVSDFQKFHDAFWAKVDKDSAADIRHLIDLYDAKILLSDEKLGQLFAKLEENKQLENTVIILTSDHGEEFYEHGSFNHSNLYDEVLRVPFLIKIPKLKKSFWVEGLTQNIDIAPTILDFLGLPKEPGFSGKSLVPLMNGTLQKVNDYTISQWSRSTSIRSKEWKLLLSEGKSKELYDLKKDPKEKENVINNHPEIVKKLEEELINVLKTIDFEFIPANQNLDEKTREKLIREGYF